MTIARLARQAKRPRGFCVKMTAVAVMGFCFIFVWSMFSSSSTSATTQRESFDDIAEPVAGNTRVSRPHTQSRERERKA
jgi:tRNA wybutosine-synthesizing protein 1